MVGNRITNVAIVGVSFKIQTPHTSITRGNETILILINSGKLRRVETVVVSWRKQFLKLGNIP